MRLSESLRRGIMKTGVGEIVNRFKAKSRRDTLFFEDILANYIKECEKAGYEKRMEEIGQKWMNLTTNYLVPAPFKRLPITFILQRAKKIWINIGILEDINVKKTGNIITLSTKKETISRIIGNNNFAIGCFAGVLSGCLNSNVTPIKVSQSKESSEYVYKIGKGKTKIEGKDRDQYNRLSTVPFTKGFTLKDAIKRNIFQVKKNRIYFRGKSICHLENTLFHIISNMDVLLEKVPRISYNFFNSKVEKNSPPHRKLILLKNILEAMGWGVIKIVSANENKIVIEIRNPSHGLQKEEDNWKFLIKVILGYLWLINKNLKVTNIHKSHERLVILSTN